MKPLDYFVRLEDSDSSGRGDRHEALSDWLQPNKIKLELNGFQINSTDLAGPVFIRSNQHLAQNVFCMRASYVGGNAPSTFATTDAFEQHLKIPQQNISLGQYSAVITNVKEFFQRIKTAANEQSLALRGRLVNYYDPASFHGNFTEEDAPFNKQIQFAHQREYRLVLSRHKNIVSPYSLNIGDLRDIAHLVPIESLNEGIKISPLAKHPLA